MQYVIKTHHRSSIYIPCRVPKGLRLTTLQDADAVKLNEDWKEGTDREGLDGYFSGVVSKFDSSCLLDDKGTLLAYICMQYNGSMAMLFVKPECRTEGYFDIVLRDLTRKRLLKGEIAYGFIPTHDTSLINLCRKFGYEWVPQGDMTWVKYSPNQKQTNQKGSSPTNTPLESNSTSKTDDAKSVIQPFLINAIPLTLNL